MPQPGVAALLRCLSSSVSGAAELREPAAARDAGTPRFGPGVALAFLPSPQPPLYIRPRSFPALGRKEQNGRVERISVAAKKETPKPQDKGIAGQGKEER